MPRPRVGAICISVAIVLSFTAVGASPAVATSGGLAGKSAQQVVSIARASAIAKGSVRIVESDQCGSQQCEGGEIYDQSKTEGRELDSGPDGTILVIKGIAYAKGGTAWLLYDSGDPLPNISQAQATEYAGKWIAFHKGDQDYDQVVHGETIVQFLKDDLPVAPLSKPKFTTLNGKKVVIIHGGVNNSFSSNNGGLGTNTVYVSTSPPYLPVEAVTYGAITYEATGDSPGGPVTNTHTFSKWGEKISFSPPSNSIPASSSLS